MKLEVFIVMSNLVTGAVVGLVALVCAASGVNPGFTAAMTVASATLLVFGFFGAVARLIMSGMRGSNGH